ncbi:MAG: purQ [Spirochaetes bacterium]|nr:MAG: purQ [Spirochaetota bacterium]
MKEPKAIVLHAAGTNRDVDAYYALKAAGADPRIIHVNALRKERSLLARSAILVIPGGFSYADAMGAGTLFALDIASYFKEEVSQFVAEGKAVLGICNGFQTLVKAGILPGFGGETRWATLTDNAEGRFECRWVTLAADESPCVWTKEVVFPVSCPVAHGEGRFAVSSLEKLTQLEEQGLIALRYVDEAGNPAQGRYPINPNGSPLDIAGICNPAGNVLGLMPHPENNIYKDRPVYGGGESGSGLSIFAAGVRYARAL